MRPVPSTFSILYLFITRSLSVSKVFTASGWYIDISTKVFRKILSHSNTKSTPNIGVWSVQNTLIQPRYNLAGAGDQSVALAFGGRTSSSGSIVGTTELYIALSGSVWSAGQSMIYPRELMAGFGVQVGNNSVLAVAAGGNAAKHIASAEIWGKRKKYIGEGNVTEGVKKEESIGAYVELSTAKNRLGLPFRKLNVPIFFGKGVSNLWAYKEWLEENTWTNKETAEILPCIEKSGSWYQVNLPFISKKVQGDNAVWKILLDNVDAVKAFVAQLAVPCNEPVNEFAIIDPVTVRLLVKLPEPETSNL